MASVFLSYRREDSRADAGRLSDRLTRHFGADSLFMDIDDIDAGENFVEKLKDTLSHCDVLLLLIGPRWQSIADAEGRPRLSAPNDFVRLEAQSALERGILLIPVLVGGASMPQAHELPAELADLAVHQGIQISDLRFHEDVDRLITAIERRTGKPPRPLWRRPSTWVALGLLVVALAFAGVYFLRPEILTGPPGLRSTPLVISGTRAKVMLSAHGFYHAAWNAHGPGLVHQYTSAVAGDHVLVLDGTTKLAWQKDGSGRALGYEDAVALIQELNASRYAGHGDWRLPTFEEAMSLMEPAKSDDDYHLDPIFERQAAPFVWTTDTNPQGRRWVVYYYDGTGVVESAQFNAYVRAVRTLTP